jgi:ADP-ribosylglycohydrolase
MSNSAMFDRQRGTLFGLAVGDALGAAVEFKPPGAFKPVVGFRGGSPHGLGPGEWTDDTSMALALADSIARAGWDLNDQARRYLDCGSSAIAFKALSTAVSNPRPLEGCAPHTNSMPLCSPVRRLR